MNGEVLSRVRDEVLAAGRRLGGKLRVTPLEESPCLSRLITGDVRLKLENIQLTGSFKVRGALNKILSLSPEEREWGVVTASSGNHGTAMAFLMQRYACSGTIFLPEYTSTAKQEALRMYGAQIILHGNDCLEAEQLARATAEREGRIYVSPYNDWQVVGGQGTVGVELARQCENLDAVLVPVGGGGLMAGVGGYLKTWNPQIRVIACQPERSPVMAASLQAGRIVEMESGPTLSDGTAGGMEPEAITFPVCQSVVDDCILVTEEEIAAAIRLMVERHHLLVEGGAALTVAALCQQPQRFHNQTVALIISGARISLDVLRRILGRE
ncbi:MAG: threonine/serine dehydratase [Acidobacteria bacterium]|nr:threonine/serine dehydratase [Acidobacteriota bacterium]